MLGDGVKTDIDAANGGGLAAGAVVVALRLLSFRPAGRWVQAGAFVGLLLGSLCGEREASAQQAIVTMPSADVTPERRFFFMHETQARAWGPRRYWAGTYFLTFGVGYETELAATVFDQGAYGPGEGANTSLALGFKSAAPLFRARYPALELRLNFGAMAMVSLVGRGVGHWLYVIPSVRLPVLQTRLAVGVSHASEQFYGPGYNRLSFVASIEQPIAPIRGLSLVAEWFSGTHELANLIVGATWHPNPTWIFVLGWKIPTRYSTFSVDDMAVVAEVGVFFPRIGPPPAGGDDDH